MFLYAFRPPGHHYKQASELDLEVVLLSERLRAWLGVQICPELAKGLQYVHSFLAWLEASSLTGGEEEEHAHQLFNLASMHRAV